MSIPRRFADDGLLETEDIYDRTTHYVNVIAEEDDTLGLIAWIGSRPGARMICLCPEGRRIYEDRQDGSLTWQDAGCAHEVRYLATLERRTIRRPEMGVNWEAFE